MLRVIVVAISWVMKIVFDTLLSPLFYLERKLRCSFREHLENAFRELFQRFLRAPYLVLTQATYGVEAENCRPVFTLSDGQRVWRLTSMVASPNSGCDCLVLLKLR